MLLVNGDILGGVILIPRQGQIGAVIFHGDLTKGLHFSLVHHGWFLSVQHQGALKVKRTEMYNLKHANG